jgi:hypothetical protein
MSAAQRCGRAGLPLIDSWGAGHKRKMGRDENLSYSQLMGRGQTNISASVSDLRSAVSRGAMHIQGRLGMAPAMEYFPPRGMADSPSDPDAVKELFRSLEGQRFVSYGDFEQAVNDAFADFRDGLLLSYKPRQAIAWGRQNGWVTDDDDGLLIHVD